ncbi:MAG: aspartate kinase [Tissierellia bacterium]|nr:aspartate kinase [Tissierellia bacterium]
MSIKVSKFGGSSLANSKQYQRVYDIVHEDRTRKFIVASAPGKSHSDDTKITDLLYLCYDLAAHNINFHETLDIVEKKFREIVENIGVDFDLDASIQILKEELDSGKSRDHIASRGEFIGSQILAKYLGYEFVDAKELIFFDDRGQFMEKKSYDKIYELRKTDKNYVIPGFYGIMPNGEIKTFSRGGGDLTGSIISRGVKTDLYENWTDVTGIMSADPRIVKNPRNVEMITYRELRELSYAGASVLHEEAILPVTHAGIPIEIKNTFHPEDKGTFIVPDNDIEVQKMTRGVTGIAGRKHFSVVNIEKVRMNQDKGFHRKLMSVIEVNDMKVEHMPTSIDSISLIIADKYLQGRVDSLVSEINTFCNPDIIKITSNIALISVVGRGMKNHIGVSANLFTALAKDNINIQMIIQGSSELNIIVGIHEDDYEKAIRAIYNAFLD